MSDESKGEKQMTASEKTELYDVLRGIQTGTVDRKVAAEVQGRLKAKYPNTYGTVRTQLGNDLAKTSNSKGKAVTKKDIPVIAISVGVGKMKKPEKKTKMMRGGMANGKEHMYSAGGVVNDGLKALKASGPKGLEAYNKITGK
jgi:hypothetical protein